MKSILYCQNVENTIKYKIINQYHDSIIISTLQKVDIDGDYSFVGVNRGKAGHSDHDDNQLMKPIYPLKILLDSKGYIYYLTSANGQIKIN